jgi:hypothetical protein
MARKKSFKHGNIEAVYITYKQQIRNKWFQKGYNSKLKKLKFDYDIENDDDAWMYERGRMFATVYQGKLIDRGSVVIEAERQLVHAFMNKIVI